MIGSTIGRYKILEKLGEGGMGVVYKAEDTRLNRMVALKFLPPHLVSDGELRERFEREARAAAALNHPNVCTIFEIDEFEETPFLAMEWVQGETLAQKIADGGPLRIEEALDLAVQAARGLAEAHGTGIVHRDIKSANIMVTPPKTGSEGLVKLMDFGLAHLAGTQAQLTREGTTLGTTAYMAPEQAHGDKVDRRADIWAFGVVLYEMVAGRQPFRGDYEQAVIYSILNEPPEALTAAREGTPAELDRIVAKALEKNAEARYQTVDEMLADLDALRRSQEPPAVDPRSTAKPDDKRWIAIAAAAATLLALAFLWPRGSPEPAPSPPQQPPVPLTSYPGVERDPSFSPDGNQAVFAWNGENQNNYDIYATVVGSAGAPLRLTDHSAHENSPAWSPNGQWIAFFRHQEERDVVFLVSPLGGSPRRLIEFAGGSARASLNFFEPGIAWGAEAKTLYVCAREASGEPYAVFSVDIESGDRRRITEPEADYYGDISVAVSPRGDRLAVAQWRFGEQSSIFVVDLPEGRATEVGQVDNNISGLAWTASGEELIFSHFSLQGAGGIDRIRLTGSARASIQSARSPRGRIALSPDGNRFAYEHWRLDVNLWRYEGSGEGAPRKIASSSFDEYSPRISPDGARIVFTSSRSGASEVWVTDADGDNLLQLTNFRGSGVGSPRWSPDGRRIAFDSNESGNWDIWIVDAQGGSPKPLAAAEGADSRPSFSKDGRWVYFASMRSGRREVWKVPADGGEAVQVTLNGGSNPFESSDGQVVYYTRTGDQLGQPYGGDLYRMPVAGGEETRVLSLPGADGHYHPAEEGVYFLDFDRQTSETLLMLLLEDEDEPRLVRRLAGPPAGTAHPVSVAPDGTWLVYSQVDSTESDLMLIEGFQ